MEIKVLRSERLFGIKYWAIHYSYPVKPLFFVFKYMGFNPDTGTYYFQSIKKPRCLLTRSFYQLSTPSFRPFCIEHSEVARAIGELEPEGRMKIANLHF